jgi:propanol-preferring alcohol dehydrogenase
MLLKTAVASFCHTDIMVQTGVLRSQLPITASHEGTGTVVALGSAVRDFKIGDRVISGVIQNRCGHCEDCNSLHTQYCSCPKGGLGVRSDGAFAEYFLTDSREASHVPDELNFTVAAPLACAGILNPGEWLGMVGSGGGLGHLGTLFAKAQGLHVVGINAREQGLELSKEVGADVVLDARQGKESVIKSVLEATNGKGVSATLNVSDAASAASLACAITKRHGKMIQIAQVSPSVLLGALSTDFIILP